MRLFIRLTKKKKRIDIIKTIPVIKKVKKAVLQPLKLIPSSLVSQMQRRKITKINFVQIKRHITLVKSNTIIVRI